MPLGHLIALISNAHRVHPASFRPGEERLSASELRLGAHCTERPEVNQDKPNPKASRLREISRGPPHQPLAQPMLLERVDVYVAAQAYPLFTMSRKPLRAWRGRKLCSLTWMPYWKALVEPVGIEPTTSSLQS